jgi:hypothetical protein
MATPSAAPSGAHSGSSPSGAGIYVAFIPWILFSVISRHDTLAAGAVVALVAAAIIAFPGIRSGHPKMLELGTIAAFVVFTAVALAVDPADGDWLTRYARAIAAAMLAAIAFLSLLGTPFTAQYARETVPRALWDTPRFIRINRELTTMWACVFLAMVPSHVLAGLIDTRRANTIFNWVIPIALIWWAVTRTAKLSGSGGASPAADEPAR